MTGQTEITKFEVIDGKTIDLSNETSIAENNLDSNAIILSLQRDNDEDDVQPVYHNLDANKETLKEKTVLKAGLSEIIIDDSWKNIPKLTKKQIKFIETLFVNGFVMKDAYLTAYQNVKSNQEASRAASKLIKKTHIALAISRLQAEVRKNATISRSDMVSELNLQARRCKENGQIGLWIKIMDMLNKMGGLYYNPAIQINQQFNNTEPNQEVKFTFGGVDPDEDQSKQNINDDDIVEDIDYEDV